MPDITEGFRLAFDAASVLAVAILAWRNHCLRKQLDDNRSIIRDWRSRYDFAFRDYSLAFKALIRLTGSGAAALTALDAEQSQ